MRLIDADALLEQYNLKDATNYRNKDDERRAHSFSTMMLYEITDMIEDAPTAYDSDKVVEQLEEFGQKMSESKSIQKYGKSSPANHRYYKAVSVKRAIEIVKGGGLNG